MQYVRIRWSAFVLRSEPTHYGAPLSILVRALLYMPLTFYVKTHARQWPSRTSETPTIQGPRVATVICIPPCWHPVLLPMLRGADRNLRRREWQVGAAENYFGGRTCFWVVIDGSGGRCFGSLLDARRNGRIQVSLKRGVNSAIEFSSRARQIAGRCAISSVRSHFLDLRLGSLFAKLCPATRTLVGLVAESVNLGDLRTHYLHGIFAINSLNAASDSFFRQSRSTKRMQRRRVGAY